MKFIRIVVFQFILLFLFYSCSGVPRFTSRHPEEEREKPDDRREATLNDETKTEDHTVLETTSGVASYYSDKFHGKQTASGEIYDKNELTAAHLDYPFNTTVRVTNLKNNKSVILRINDRKPEFNGRIIDISYQAAEELDMVISGIAEVRVEVLKWGTKK